jgi:hypothetical protein
MVRVNKTSTSGPGILNIDPSFRPAPRPPCPGLVLRLRPGGQELALQRLYVSPAVPQLAPKVAPGDPSSRGSDDKTRQQEQ